MKEMSYLGLQLRYINKKREKQFREQNIYVFIFCLKIVDNVKNIIRYYYTLYI